MFFQDALKLPFSFVSLLGFGGREGREGEAEKTLVI